MSNQLLIVTQQNNLTATEAESLHSAFAPIFQQASEWAQKVGALSVTDVSQTREMKLARESRLALKEIRCKSEHLRKQLKEESLRKGKAIDGMHNIIAYLTEPLEQKLLDMEQFAERKERARLDERLKERALALAYYEYTTIDAPTLRALTDEAYDAILESARARHESLVAERVQLEQERLTKEKAEAEERERVRLENERLKAEAAAREEQMRLEREAAEKAAKEAKAKADAEKRAALEKERKAREAEMAKMRAEQAARDEAARKERAKAEEAALAEQQRLAKVAADERAARKLAEEAAARELAVQQAEIDRQRREQEAAQKKLREEQAEKLRKEQEKAAAARVAQRKAEAELAEQKRREEAARAQAEAKAQAEREAAEAARKQAEFAPDKDKLELFLAQLCSVGVPALTSEIGQRAQHDLAAMKRQYEQAVRHFIGRL